MRGHNVRGDYTREGNSQSKDYRTMLYPDDDYSYGEEDERYYHAPRRTSKKFAYRKWMRERMPLFSSHGNSDWETHRLTADLRVVAWGLNRNELAILKYLNFYCGSSAYLINVPLIYRSSDEYCHGKLVEFGYDPKTPGAKAGAYAQTLWNLGLVDKRDRTLFGRDYRITEAGKRVLELRA